MAVETDQEMFKRVCGEVAELAFRPDVSKLIDEVIAMQKAMRAAKGKLFVLIGRKHGESLWGALQDTDRD